MDMLNKLKSKINESSSSHSNSLPEKEVDGTSAPRISDEYGNTNDVIKLKEQIDHLKALINRNYNVYLKRLEKRKDRIRTLEEELEVKKVDKENDSSQQLEEANNTITEKQIQISELTKSNFEMQLKIQQQDIKIQHLSGIIPVHITDDVVEESEDVKCMDGKAAVDILDNKNERSSQLEELVNEPNENVDEQSVVEGASDKFCETAEKEVHNQDGQESEHGIDIDQNTSPSPDSCTVDHLSVLEMKMLRKELVSTKCSLVDMQQQLKQRDVKISNLLDDQSKLKSTILDMELSIVALKKASKESAKLVNESKSKMGEPDAKDLEIAQLQTKLETSNLALNHREREGRLVKEHHKNELLSVNEGKKKVEEDMKAISERLLHSHGEIIVLKQKMRDEESKLLENNKEMSKLEDVIKFLENSLESQTSQTKRVQTELTTEKTSTAQLKDKHREMEKRFDQLNQDYDKVMIEFGDCSAENEKMTSRLQDLSTQYESVKVECESHRLRVSELENTFVDRMERSQMVLMLRENLRQVSDELQDKRQLIKLHTHRISDMKRTFQKEFNVVSHGQEGAKKDSSSTFISSAGENRSMVNLSTNSMIPDSNVHLDHDEDMSMITPINFKYLKHVIMKFFTTKDQEVQAQLGKAISAVLKFNREEERIFQQHLVWKSSWFHAPSHLLTTSPQ